MHRNRLHFVIIAGILLCTALSCSNQETALQGTSPVNAVETNEQLTLDNGIIRIAFDRAKGLFTASRDGVTFIHCGNVRHSSGVSRDITVENQLGIGRAIELAYADGNADRIMLFPNFPFICIQSMLANTTDNMIVVSEVVPAGVEINIGNKSAIDMRTLGSDGVTNGEVSRTSYAFLAVADPEAQTAVVAGWLTHKSGSGIVMSAGYRENIRIDARCEYGKLQIEPGESVSGEIYAVGYFENAHDGLETFADGIAKANEIGPLKPIPSGYCTWYSDPYGLASDEEHMAILADFCEEELTKFGFDLLQIDDRWQLSNRDFTTHNPDGPYPNGMKKTSEKITSSGMTAGLWFTPFGWDPSRPIFDDHQDWFMHYPGGEPYQVVFAGTCLDMTHPETPAFLESIVSRITREWDYKYIKIDGLWSGMGVRHLYPSPAYRYDTLGTTKYFNPKMTQIDAYRTGLEIVRAGAGDDVYILGCNIAQNMRTLGGSYGLVDGMRVGRDIGANWKAIFPSVEMMTRLYFFHNRVWHNDPDCLMIREPMTLDQARAWGSVISLSGQLNLASEWLPGLPAERLDIVKRSMPNHGLCGRPIDMFENDPAKIWQLTDDRGDRRYDVIGLFNWAENDADTIELDISRLSLEGGDSGEYIGFDYWENEFIPPFSRSKSFSMRPSSCRVIALRKASDHPQVISTSRHITQGMIDIETETWDDQNSMLAGVSNVVGDDSYEIRIMHARKGKAISATVSSADSDAGVTISMRQNNGTIRATVKSPENRRVSWSVQFN